MLVNETFFINSCDDYELNIKRKSKLEFRISYDDTKELKAIVFDIGGFGANTNLSFLDSARVALAKKFNILVVHVFHHCFAIRHNEQDKRYSCTFEMNDEGLKQLEIALNFFNLKAKDGLSKANAFSISIELGKLLVQLKKEGKIEDKGAKNVRKFLAVPPNDEYQNYGVMAALDHINALKFIQNTFKLHHLPTIVGGGSYGAYIANLMAKFYPLGIQAVVDNSSPVAPVLWYFLGEYMDKFELYYDFDAIDSFFIINAKSMWSLDENSPYYFKKSNLAIRVLLDKEHLSKQALKNNKTIYIAYQGIDDKSDANPDKKREFYELLKHFGFDANLLLFSKKDIDGKFIKNTEHGLGLSNKLMLKRELPLLLEKLQDYKPSTEDKSISYVCDNELFSFKDMKTKLKLEIKKLKT